MAKLVTKSTKHAGAPPGTLVHVGEKKTDRVRIVVIDYDREKIEKHELTSVEEAVAFKSSKTVSWLNVYGIHDVQVLQRLGDRFGLHALVLEDILNTGHRPKIEESDGDYLFIVLKLLRYDDENDAIDADQISIVLGQSYVLTLQERAVNFFNPIRERLEQRDSRLRQNGADYLVYRLLDTIVDRYFVILEKLGERLEILEDKVMDNPDHQCVQALHALKRELIFLRKTIWPLREIISVLSREQSPLVTESTQFFLRDVYDHAIHVIDTVESFRDMVSGLFDIYMSSVSNRMNEVMKVLTVIATIFIPLTFIAGIYGMNFDSGASPWNMPELRWYLGYPLALIAMALVAIVMVVFFKKRDWL